MWGELVHCRSTITLSLTGRIFKAHAGKIRNEFERMERRYDFRCRRKPKYSEKTCAGKYGLKTKFTYDSSGRLEIEPGPHWWKAREQPLRQPACPKNHSLAIFVSPELSSKRDYVITHCVRSMYVVCSVYVVCSMYVYVCVLFCKIDHCIHIHWCIPMGLGHKDSWVASHMWPQQTGGQRSSGGSWPLVQVFDKKVTVSTYFDIFSWNLDKMILRQSHTCDLNRSGIKGHLGVIDRLVKFFKNSVTVSTFFYVYHGSWTNIKMIVKVFDRESRRDSCFENRLVYLGKC